MNVIPQHYPVADIAAALSVSPKTIFRMIEAGTLPAVKIGQQWRVSEADVQALISAKNSLNDR